MALDTLKVDESTTPGAPGVAVDNIAGVRYEIAKSAFGAAGTATLVDADHGLPVDVKTLPPGASTEATLAALKAVADTIATAAAAIKVAAEALNAKATEINTGAIAGTVALDATSLAALETISVANFPGTQPISGNVGITGAVEIVNDLGNAIPVSAASLPLPAGAATEVTLSSVDGKLPALSAGRIPVVLPTGGSGLTDTELRASAVPTIQAGAVNGTPTNVAASAASTVLLASNAARKGATIRNDSTASLYVLCNASAASSTNYTELLGPGESLVLEPGDYTGEIRGIWTAANGYARVTEFA